MNLHDRQLDLEVNSVQRGLERYYAVQASARERNREFDCPVGQNLMSDCLSEFAPAIRTLQAQVRKDWKAMLKTGRRLTGCEMEFLALSPEVWGYLTIRTALLGVRSTQTVNISARGLGSVGNLEVRWAELRSLERLASKEEARPNRVELMRRRVKQVDPKSVRSWLKKLDDLATLEWGNATRMRIGRTLLQLLTDTLPEVFEKKQVTTVKRGRYKTEVSLRLSEETEARLIAEHKDASELEPWLMPMVCPPVHWHPQGGSYQGGYLKPTQPLFKRSTNEHTKALGAEVPQEVLDALNIIQATPFRVNRRVLEVAEEALALNSEMLPAPPEKPLPAAIPNEQWEEMTARERGIAKSERRMVHDHNNRSYAKRQALRRQLTVAQDVLAEEAIYFPHNLDFRGRMYPIPQDLHPQADDMARGLLTFAEGKPLGTSGLMWLTYYVAATYGLDKASREAQSEWVANHADELWAVAQEPLGIGLNFWSMAEEPWQFLAAAMELEAAFRCGNAVEYVSSLPIHVDGTCNGLQHLSAMGRDPKGAFATNLNSLCSR